jgi:indolepyruvate ferredoxin oxidoreductase beta subunit
MRAGMSKRSYPEGEKIIMTHSILLVGVGGQGTILASKILVLGLMEAGYDVKMSEIHGMSQRGGSVSSQIRYGEKVQSPVIDKGAAEVIVAFEKMEALRWLDYISPNGKIVVNNCEISSMSVLNGKEKYAANVVEELAVAVSTQLVDASEIAMKLGNVKVMNVVLLGTTIKSMNLEHIDWNKIIRENVKSTFIDLNLKALEAGINAVA